MSSSTTPTEAARTLGRYRLIAALGQGGTARVYLAIASGPARFNKLLVVKELRPEIEEDPDFLASFLDEARLAARLNHPNVVQTYEVGVEDGRHYIAMEYLEGQSLSALLRRREPELIPMPVHLKILSTALQGLHYAHELCDFDGTRLDVVHRDVSPQNVFVTYDGQVKIVDFGIAKAHGAAAQTKSGVIKGKMRYMAPEQTLAQAVDRRSDVFACGVMLWEALARRRMGMGLTEVELAQQRMLGTEPKIKQVAPDTPESLARVCDRALAHEAAERYSTAAEFRKDLDAAIEAEYGRVDNEQIAQILCEAFAEDRKKLRELVDAQVKKADSLAPDKVGDLAMLAVGDATLRSGDSSSTPTMRPSLPSGDITDLSLPGTVPASAVGVAKPKSRGTQWWVMGVILGLGLLTYGATRLQHRQAPMAASPAANEQPVPVAPTVAPPSAEPAKNETVTLDLSATPDGAALELDGAPLTSNPFRATLKKDMAPHRLRASLAGYDSAERVVVFDNDVKLALDLVKSKTKAPSARPVGAKPKPTASPGARMIDEKDPYGP